MIKNCRYLFALAVAFLFASVASKAGQTTVESVTLPNGATVSYGLTQGVEGEFVTFLNYPSPLWGMLRVTFEHSFLQQRAAATLSLPSDTTIMSFKVVGDEIHRSVEYSDGSMFATEASEAQQLVSANSVATCEDLISPTVSAAAELLSELRQVVAVEELQSDPFSTIFAILRTPVDFERLHPQCIYTSLPEPQWGVCAAADEWVACQQCCDLDDTGDTTFCSAAVGAVAYGLGLLAGPGFAGWAGAGASAAESAAGNLICGSINYDECETRTCAGKSGDPSAVSCQPSGGGIGVCMATCREPGHFRGLCENNLHCCQDPLDPCNFCVPPDCPAQCFN